LAHAETRGYWRRLKDTAAMKKASKQLNSKSDHADGTRARLAQRITSFIGHQENLITDTPYRSLSMKRRNAFAKNGGDDETRTRDLCRDRAAF
jgi:hypothetical protein